MDPDFEPRQALRNQGSYLTRQRLLVLDILRELPGHPDAGAIFQEAKKRDHRISLATVYRSLAFLKAVGLVEENKLGEDHSHFEATQDTDHYHFTCLSCGKVIEFEVPGMPFILLELSERENLSVTATNFHLQGYCSDCQESHLQKPSKIVIVEEISNQPEPIRGQEKTSKPVPISGLAIGKTGIVCGIIGGKEFTSRVASLGFTIGAQVTVLQNTGHGPMIVSLFGSHIALGRQEARQIQVQLP